jgi:hypothetical protein
MLSKITPGVFELLMSFYCSKLAKLKADEVHVTAYDYPLFLYDEDLMDSGNMTAGLCRGFLLLRVGRNRYTG